MPNLVINTLETLEAGKLMLERVFKTRTIQNGEIFHLFLEPFASPKTHAQLAAIGVLCRQLSKTVSHDHSGHSVQYWKKYYKIRAYIPLLKIQAHEKKDQKLIDLIESASSMLKQQKAAELFKYDPISIIDMQNAHFKEFYKTGMYTIECALSEAKKATLNKDSELMAKNDDYSVESFIADNAAFSYSKASKANLIAVIDYMIKDAKANGIELVLKNKQEVYEEKQAKLEQAKK